MAANKFATMLHNNTNKLTLVLIYAVLEWTLIVLLLVNSVFSYLIVKFAQYFGLDPPCFWCARIDRFRYHLCELHAKEVSQLGFCSKHKKLVEVGDMCEDCSSSDLGFQKESRNIMFSKVERIDVSRCDGEDEVNLMCSCCGVNFERKFVDSSCFVIHPLCDYDFVDSANKETLIDDHIEKEVSIEHIKPNYVEENQDIDDEDEELDTEQHTIEVIRDSNFMEHDLIQFENGEDLNSQDLQFFIDYSGNQLFPFELPDPKTEERQNETEDEDHEFGDFQKAQKNSQEIVNSDHQKTEEAYKFADNLIDFGNETAIDEEIQTQILLMDTKELRENDPDVNLVLEDEDASIGPEIPVLESTDDIKHEEPSTNPNNLHSNLENDFEEAEEESAGKLKNLGVNVEDVDEDKGPDTPSSIYSPNPLHKRWLIPDMKEQGVEEPYDGSVTIETDGGDPVTAAVKLKSALRAERKALHSLYMELEEERNASAVATNETMAMINRLQEEKAAVQMEALQYQRMMEEQSEYDQEALQLLNELIMKKEEELESYRKKVSDYEANEKIRVLQQGMKAGTSSISWSHSEDDEGSSIDLYQVPKDEKALDTNREIQNLSTPIESVLDLESSLAGFEEERLSILEQLKFLEEKLFALSDEENRHFANIRVIQDHYEEIDNVRFNGKQPMGKRLFPIFDATGNEDGDDVTLRNGNENGFRASNFEDTAITRFELEKKRIDMEEEVDQLYRRLQALETDKEFLKHCIGSMKKGDKGMELLQEILHHLRHLRDVDLRAKNYADNALL